METERNERRPVGRPRKVREDGELRRVPDAAAPGKQPIRLPPWDGKTRGPTLGRTRPDDLEWHPQTHKWWKVWRQSPQAMFCEPTDWESLFLAALIYDQIMKGCSHTALANLSSELRKREGAVGASIEDRLRLGMSPDRPNAAVQEAQIQQGVKEVIDYAERLGKRVADGPA